MPEMTGAQAMFEMMVREGVRYVFGNPGTTELPLMDLFAERGDLTYILSLHEDSALGMAVGYAEATGRPAVVNLHTAPGLAHGLGNLYNAKRAGTPLVVTAGQQDTRVMIEEPLLYGDMVDQVRQYTKWAWEVRQASEVAAAMSRAFRIARTPPTGPVFLSLPVDVMERSAMIDLPPHTAVAARTRPEPGSIEAAASILTKASSPAIISGDGVARAGAVAAVVKLAEAVGARVYSEPLNSLLDFPTNHPLYCGPLFANAKQVQEQLRSADLILLIGVNILTPLVNTGEKMLPARAKIIQIDADPRELGKNYPAEAAIMADPLFAVEELIETITPMLTGSYSLEVIRRRHVVLSEVADARGKFSAAATSASGDGTMTPAFVAREMRAAAAKDAVLVDESVTSTAFVRTIFDLEQPNSYFYAKGGSLGLGLPEAVGVKLAMPERQVLCAVGDGSALYSIQALWTAAHYKLAVVFVVFNNTSYMILKGGLLAMKGSSAKKGVFTGMDLTEPAIDFVRLAESLGVSARSVSHASELRPALDWALAEGGPTLLDVTINRDVRSVLR